MYSVTGERVGPGAGGPGEGAGVPRQPAAAVAASATSCPPLERRAGTRGDPYRTSDGLPTGRRSADVHPGARFRLLGGHPGDHLAVRLLLLQQWSATDGQRRRHEILFGDGFIGTQAHLLPKFSFSWDFVQFSLKMLKNAKFS